MASFATSCKTITKKILSDTKQSGSISAYPDFFWTVRQTSGCGLSGFIPKLSQETGSFSAEHFVIDGQWLSPDLYIVTAGSPEAKDGILYTFVFRQLESGPILFHCCLGPKTDNQSLGPLLRHLHELEEENERYRLSGDLTGSILFEYNIQGGRLAFYGQFSEIFGQKTVYHSVHSLAKNRSNPILSDFFDRLLLASKRGPGENNFTCMLRMHTRKGKDEWFRILSTTVLNDKNEPLKVIGKIKNINEEVTEQKRLLKKTQTDPLTRVYNRPSLEQAINQHFEQAHPAAASAVFVIDIDNFKSANDLLGHLQGDNVLIDLTNLLKSVFSSNDLIGRVGGDEFVVFMRDSVTEYSIAEKAKWLLCKSHLRYQKQGVQYTLSISAGITIARGCGMTYQQLFNQADQALYQAKRNGKNQYRIFTGEDYPPELSSESTGIYTAPHPAADVLVKGLLRRLGQSRSEDSVILCLKDICRSLSLDVVCLKTQKGSYSWPAGKTAAVSSNTIAYDQDGIRVWRTPSGSYLECCLNRGEPHNGYSLLGFSDHAQSIPRQSREVLRTAADLFCCMRFSE